MIKNLTWLAGISDGGTLSGTSVTCVELERETPEARGMTGCFVTKMMTMIRMTMIMG